MSTSVKVKRIDLRNGGAYVAGPRGYIPQDDGSRMCNICGATGNRRWWYGEGPNRGHNDLVHIPCGFGCGRELTVESVLSDYEGRYVDGSPLRAHEFTEHGEAKTKVRIERRGRG